jgi:DnaA family protein
MEQLILALAPPAPASLHNFYAGANAAALAALRGLLAHGPERAIHLWGPAGSGRTHLLQAAAAGVAAAGGAVAWVPGGAAAAPDLVLCDDVDQLDAHGELEAFRMVDAARREGARILSAALCPAHQLGVRDDLRTRLAQSLSQPLVPLSDDEKRVAVASHAADRGMRLAPEIVDYVIARVQRDMGTLMGVVDALDRYSLSEKRPLTVPLAREVLQRLAV